MKRVPVLTKNKRTENIILKNKTTRPVYIFNASIQEADAGGSLVPGQYIVRLAQTVTKLSQSRVLHNSKYSQPLGHLQAL